MSFKSLFVAAAISPTLAGMAVAEDMPKMMVHDAYARAATKTSTSGAAFMEVMNHTGQDDRLIAVSSSAAAKTQLHTHVEDANGVMKMRHVEDGFAIPAGDRHLLKRGGDHVMLMGLTEPLEQGGSIPVTLTFETAGDIVVEVPVDLERKPGAGSMDHSNMDHSN